MVLIWYEYALIAAIFATTLTLTVWIAFLLSRVRVQKWIGGAIGNFMTNLANQAAEEEGTGIPGTTSPGAGVLKLGGFSIDIRTIKELLPVLPQLMEAAKMFGLLKGGGGAGAGGYVRP